MISIDVLRQLNTANHYMITEHARIRLFERNITIDDVICCVENGKIIEQYENDKPFPSCLILGVELKGKYIHVVVSCNEDYIYLITAYYPDEQLWQDNSKQGGTDNVMCKLWLKSRKRFYNQCYRFRQLPYNYKKCSVL